MKNSILTFIVQGLFIICFSVMIKGNVQANNPEFSLQEQFILKHRIAVIQTSSNNEKVNSSEIIIKFLDSRKIVTDEALSLSMEDYAATIDLTKDIISSSELMRVVELDNIVSDNSNYFDELYSANENLELVLIASYGILKDKNRVFFRLIELPSGDILKSAEGIGLDLKEAIQSAVEQIEEFLLTRPWRAKIISSTNNAIIINRGSLDGIEEGYKFIGYSIKNDNQKVSNDSLDLLLLKFGTKEGIYIITEVKLKYSKAEPFNGSPLLKAGDILELPEVRLKNFDRNSRGKKLWDKIYK